MTDTDRIAQMAREADSYANQYVRDNAHLRPDWIDVRDDRFARLVAEDCAKVCDERYAECMEPEAMEMAQAIRARYSKE